MAVPAVGVATVELHKAHTALEHPARQQTALAELLGDFLVEAIEFFRGLSFPRNIHDVRRVLLHAKRQLIGRDAGREF